jgi:hypothetical protein
MDDFLIDIERGYLKNGEPLEARWGTGWWTKRPEREPEYYGGECPYCYKEALYCDGTFLKCERCGKESEE